MNTRHHRLLSPMAAVSAALVTCLFCLPASAQSLQVIFSSANQAYFRGDWTAATQQYQTLVNAGVQDADVYYNLATAYARAGKLGKAVLCFERSLKLRPGDNDAEKALAAAVDALGRKRAEKQGEATVRTKPPLGVALVKPFSEELLAWLLLGFNLAFFGVLVAFRFATREATRVGLAIAAPLLGLLMAAASAGLLIKSEALMEGRAAVVLREDAPLREGPDPRAQVRAGALEGQPARILQREGEYVRVKLSGGAEGWMQRGDVEGI
jgi:tetratricopeptide (TPR) repeat protein